METKFQFTNLRATGFISQRTMIQRETLTWSESWGRVRVMIHKIYFPSSSVSTLAWLYAAKISECDFLSRSPFDLCSSYFADQMEANGRMTPHTVSITFLIFAKKSDDKSHFPIPPCNSLRTWHDTYQDLPILLFGVLHLVFYKHTLAKLSMGK